jgi:hypothetical protein
MGHVTKASSLSTYALKYPFFCTADPLSRVCRFRRALHIEVVAAELKTRLRLPHEASQNIRAAMNAALVGMVVPGDDPADCEAEGLHEYLRVKLEHVGRVLGMTMRVQYFETTLPFLSKAPGLGALILSMTALMSFSYLSESGCTCSVSPRQKSTGKFLKASNPSLK